MGGPGGMDPDLLKTINESTAHLARSLELFDRVVRAPRPGMAPEPLNLRDSLELIGSLLRIHKSPVRIDMTEALAAQLPAVAGVREHVEHALLNLLLNAQEAIGQDEGTVVVRATVHGPNVKVSVEDDGPGVRSSVLDRLFQPFVTTKTGLPGAGLGLCVARELLTRAEGTVEHSRTKHKGACFVATLKQWSH